ncbi:LysR family transcriptional regulator [Psychrobacter sp. FDAARGOS_221]|uniref:LysR family transcriptional regulator n=1 Tax=Psychrobacter sp. FDAARGOS_221 TaxID=1975705 RepID=UPI000BB555D7|nr:LysR family transcriptional regulator [Psychrobacter sp. FDAARGOS_221]PNK60670.1 LysR family transcriptional regulator [Psychrobacter sp. FDAARGOS_221]
MGQFEDMCLFIRIVEAGSITKAAEQLDIAKSAASRRLKELETRLNAQLISRTTRNSTLTDAGRQYYEQARNILSDVDILNEEISGVKAHIEGTLKMTAPLSFGLMHLSDLIDRYAKQHPNLAFELDFSDRHVDLVEEGYELGIRIGELKDSSYQARRLTEIRYVLCASPDYIAKAGMPTSLETLQTHDFLQYGLAKQSSLLLIDSDQQQHRLNTTSSIKANNGDFLVKMAAKGHGIAFIPTFIAYEALLDGTLIPLMTDYELPTINAYAVYPKNRYVSQRCRFFIDFIIEQIGDNPYWDQRLQQAAIL